MNKMKNILYTLLQNALLAIGAWGVYFAKHTPGTVPGFAITSLHVIGIVLGSLVGIFALCVIVFYFSKKLESFWIDFSSKPKQEKSFETLVHWQSTVPASIDFIIDLTYIVPFFLAGWYYVCACFVLNMIASQLNYEAIASILKMKQDVQK